MHTTPLTVTGKSQIKFFSSPEKNPINIPGVRQTPHLAFLTWAGGYLEATWNLPAQIRFPPPHCVLVNEIRELGGALRIIEWFGVTRRWFLYFSNPSYCCPALPTPGPPIFHAHLCHTVFLKAFAHIPPCLMPCCSALLTGLSQSLMFPNHIRYASSNLCFKIVKVVTFGNNQIIKMN